MEFRYICNKKVTPLFLFLFFLKFKCEPNGPLGYARGIAHPPSHFAQHLHHEFRNHGLIETLPHKGVRSANWPTCHWQAPILLLLPRYNHNIQLNWISILKKIVWGGTAMGSNCLMNKGVAIGTLRLTFYSVFILNFLRIYEK